jgi:hypothetical protein
MMQTASLASSWTRWVERERTPAHTCSAAGAHEARSRMQLSLAESDCCQLVNWWRELWPLGALPRHMQSARIWENRMSPVQTARAFEHVQPENIAVSCLQLSATWIQPPSSALMRYDHCSCASAMQMTAARSCARSRPPAYARPRPGVLGLQCPAAVAAEVAETSLHAFSRCPENVGNQKK